MQTDCNEGPIVAGGGAGENKRRAVLAAGGGAGAIALQVLDAGAHRATASGTGFKLSLNYQAKSTFCHDNVNFQSKKF